MNDKLALLLRELSNEPGLTQRALSEVTGMSLGRVNTATRECEAAGYIDERAITDAGREALGSAAQLKAQDYSWEETGRRFADTLEAMGEVPSLGNQMV